MPYRADVLALLLILGAAPVAAHAGPAGASATHTEVSVADPEDPQRTFRIETLTTLDNPWALRFMPDGRLLVTEKPGRLLIVAPQNGESTVVVGVPNVDHGGQGGLGDVQLHPEFDRNGLLYLGYAEPGEQDTRGAAVARARLVEENGAARLEDVSVIWRQIPKVTGRGHYGHRLAFDRDGYLFITSGDRQKMAPARDMTQNLGKIIRIHDDGRIPEDNPFIDPENGTDTVAAAVWTLGHRNPLGLAFAPDGQLWSHEMGPRHGDELNLIERGNDYGWPTVSNGRHYDGSRIPAHHTRPEFAAPKLWWDPAISPAGLMIHSGTLFEDWQGHAFMGGLSGRVLLRIELSGEQAREAQRFDMGARIRDVTEGPDGSIWVLEDGDDAKLLRLRPL